MEIFDKHKAKHLILYLANRNGGVMNKLKAIKLIWLADRYHLRKHGRTITGDKYVAMEHGPVPSSVKDMIEGKSGFKIASLSLDPLKHNYSTEEKADLDYFSESDQEAIDLIYKHFGSLDKFGLRDLSHNFPEWKRFEGILLSKKSSFPMIIDDFFKNVDDGSGLFIDDDNYLQDSKTIYRELA